MPVSFKYNIQVKDENRKPKVTHGIVSEGGGGGEKEKSKEEKNWYKEASGLRAEQKIFEEIQRNFSDKPCLLINGFSEHNLIKVVKSRLQLEKNGIQLSDQV